MLKRQAKTISDATLQRMLLYAEHTRYPTRDKVIVLLSVKAGLRACEMAALDWSMVTDAEGRIADEIDVRDSIAKMQSGRRIPMHPLLKKALRQLLREAAFDGRPSGPVIASRRRGHLRPNSVVNWFVVMFDTIGANGCSSHSGRRTFITNGARAVHKVGGSLRDVQLLAGHRSIETTQGYIDGNTQGQRKLIDLL